MKEQDLYKSPVVFTADPHSYHITKDGQTRELKGVTGLLSAYLFPRKYEGVDDAVIQAAAERGSRVHENCYAVGVVGAVSPEAEAYQRLMKEQGFEEVTHEYTVSDEDRIASNIDLVLQRDGKVYLADIKTTSHFDDEYVSWQLSVYKYLFGLHNPKIEVGGLLGIWLPLERYGKPRIVEVRERSADEVLWLFSCERMGTETPPPPAPKPEQVAEIVALQSNVANVFRQLKDLEGKKKQLTSALYAAMEKHNVKKWECEDFTLTRILPAARERFDAKAFREAHPSLYSEFLTTSAVAGSVKITLR